jgi:phosphonate transport system substrate-binding protein
MMPQYFLHRQGLNVNTDIENRYVGSQESTILNVYLGLTAAAATWPPPWLAFQKQHPREAAQLRVLWETETLINNAIMARGDIPDEIRDPTRALLLGVHETGEGAAILAGIEAPRFFPATDGDYEIVRRYIARFESEVRPVEGK